MFRRVVEVCHNLYRVRWALLTPETTNVHVYKGLAPYMWSDGHAHPRQMKLNGQIYVFANYCPERFTWTLSAKWSKNKDGLTFLVCGKFYIHLFQDNQRGSEETCRWWHVAALCWHNWRVTARVADSTHCWPLWPPPCAVHVQNCMCNQTMCVCQSRPPVWCWLSSTQYSLPE